MTERGTCTASWLICGESFGCQLPPGHRGKHAARIEWDPMAEEAPVARTGRPLAACPVCGREVIVTVTGHLKRHDGPPKPKGAGPRSRCPGGGEFVGIRNSGWPASSWERPQ